MKYIGELKKENLAGKKVLLRADLDVPLTQLRTTNYELRTKIGEAFRIKAQKGTLDYLVNNGAKVMIAAHLGHEVSDASFRPIIEEVGEILGQTLTFVPHSELASVGKLFEVADILLLDNLRQDKREVENDEKLAQELSRGFDLYVNNCFATMHREHSSIVGVTKNLPSYAGLLVKKEIENLNQAMDAPPEGKVLVLGGAKISTKLPVIKNFLNKAEKILIGGALANNFFKYEGIDVGKSLVDDESLSLLGGLRVKHDKKWNPQIILPEDVMISRSKDDYSEVKPFPVGDITGHYMPDIGPETAKHYGEIIGKAKMVVWNGPMGLFEADPFAEGTKIVARAVASARNSVVGGGDTIAAVNKFGLLDKYSFVSTGGGAMLEFLAGNKLAGLEALGYYFNIRITN